MILEPIKMNEEKDLFFHNKDEEKELGCIGYLRGDFGGGGKEFWTTWFPHNFPELNDEKFKVIFDAIINSSFARYKKESITQNAQGERKRNTALHAAKLTEQRQLRVCQ